MKKVFPQGWREGYGHAHERDGNVTTEDLSMNNKKVMIVDNDQELLEGLEELLDLSGYDMVTVNDSLAAVDTAIRTKPDVILLDLKMPGKTGFEVAEELRRLSMFEDVPIIAMTAFYKDSYKSLIDFCGIQKCLKKPLRPLNLISEIEFIMNNKKGVAQ